MFRLTVCDKDSICWVMMFKNNKKIKCLYEKCPLYDGGFSECDAGEIFKNCNEKILKQFGLINIT